MLSWGTQGGKDLGAKAICPWIQLVKQSQGQKESLHTPRYINLFGELLSSYLETNSPVLKGEIKTGSVFVLKFFYRERDLPNINEEN